RPAHPGGEQVRGYFTRRIGNLGVLDLLAVPTDGNPGDLVLLLELQVRRRTYLGVVVEVGVLVGPGRKMQDQPRLANRVVTVDVLTAAVHGASGGAVDDDAAAPVVDHPLRHGGVHGHLPRGPVGAVCGADDLGRPLDLGLFDPRPRGRVEVGG